MISLSGIEKDGLQTDEIAIIARAVFRCQSTIPLVTIENVPFSRDFALLFE